MIVSWLLGLYFCFSIFYIVSLLFFSFVGFDIRVFELYERFFLKSLQNKDNRINEFWRKKKSMQIEKKGAVINKKEQ